MITIRGIPYEIIKNSLIIDDALEERTTCRFAVIDLDGVEGFKRGQPIEINEDGIVLFAGVVDSAKAQRIASDGGLYHDIVGTDWHYLADKRILAKAYTEMLAGDIVKDIIDTKLAEEGVWGNSGALSFDGVDDYVTIGNLGVFPTEGTLCFWLNASEMANYRNPLTTKYNGSNSGIRFEENSLGTFNVVAGDDSGVYDTVNYIASGMSIDTWYHIAYVWDTIANTETGYLNGDQVFNQSHTLWPTTIPDFRIGTGLSTSADRQWKGKMDEVRIWNVARTQAQIQANMNQELIGNEAGLVGYWKFNEDPGSTAIDSTANGNNGTISGAFPTEGKLGSVISIQTGPLVQEAVFNYVPTTTALDALAEKAGFWWMIDFDKRLYFVPRATYTAPFAVTESNMERGSVDVTQGNPLYRNTQYIKGGTDITDPQTQEYKGDGKLTVFNTGFKVAKVPTITLNAVVQTVGIRGLDDGKQWYWSKGENTISQDNAGTPIIATDTLSITYQGEFSVVVISKNEAQIDALKIIEVDGTGIVDDVADEPSTSTRESAFQSAAAKLEKYGVIGKTLKFRTWEIGLEVGQLLTVDLPLYGLNGTEMLIDAVTVTKEDNAIWYAVSAVEGPNQGSWTRMFEKMATRGQAFVIRENISEDQVLITLQTFNESVAWTESVLQSVYACPVPSSTLYPSLTLYPC